MTHRYLALLSGLLLLGLTAFACSGDDATSTSTSTVSPTASPTAPPTTSATPSGTATPSITATASPPETPTVTETAVNTPTPGEAPLFDPALADAVAHAAVLQPNALDAFGSNWVVTQRDVFDDRPASEAFDGTVPECASVIAIFGAADVLNDTNRAGRAKLKLAQAGDTPDEVTIEGSVSVFNNVETPTSVLESFVQGFGATDFAKCFEGTLANRAPAGTTAAVRLVNPTNPTPQGGFAVAIELTVDDGSWPTVFLFENYVWRVSNAGLRVSTAGPANFDGALAAAAVGAIDAGIARVLAGDLSTPPTEEPTDVPCAEPTDAPCADPTDVPTEEPTETPTEIPTTEPGTGVAAALYEAGELPGPEAWTITEDNDFRSGPFDDLETSSDACLSVMDTAGEALARLDTGVAEGAQREYTNSPDGEAFSQGVTASI